MLFCQKSVFMEQVARTPESFRVYLPFNDKNPRKWPLEGSLSGPRRWKPNWKDQRTGAAPNTPWGRNSTARKAMNPWMFQGSRPLIFIESLIKMVMAVFRSKGYGSVQLPNRSPPLRLNCRSCNPWTSKCWAKVCVYIYIYIIPQIKDL